jgi:putative transposase
MVRAGVVKHPSEWDHCGYNEIQNPKRRNILINYERLAELLGFETYDEARSTHKQWVESCLTNGGNQQDDKWSRSIAVGSEGFIDNIKSLMRGLALGWKFIETGESHQLRESQVPYGDHFGAKKVEIAVENAYKWAESFENTI